MEGRQPIYANLLKHILPAELKQFMAILIKDLSTEKTIELSDSIDKPVYYRVRQQNWAYFHTALCCAIYINDSKIVQALLKIGADPNLNASVIYGSALLIAARLIKYNGPDVINILLNAERPIDIYVMDFAKYTAFHHVKDDTRLILKLLSHGPALSEEKKTLISEKIVIATKSIKHHAIHVALAKTMASEYDYTDESKTKTLEIIDKECNFGKGKPLGEIVLSYLFKKPDTLKQIELYASEKTQQENENKNVNNCIIS